MKIVIDLETIKCTNQGHIDYFVSKAIDKIKPNANCKSEESKAKSIQKQNDEFNAEELIDKTVFDGMYGEMITIGYAVDDNPIKSLQRDNNMTEVDILQSFFDELKALANKDNKDAKYLGIQWIGHNIIGFDLPYIYKRSVINNINTHGIKIPVDARHGRQVYDTMIAWNGWQAKSGGSLDAICKVLGLSSKDGFCGADVWCAWVRGEYSRIAEYCEDDVRLTRAVYKRLEFIKG